MTASIDIEHGPRTEYRPRERWRAHIRMERGYYRVFWVSQISGIMVTTDFAPYRERGDHVTGAAINFVQRLNRNGPPFRQPRTAHGCCVI